MESSYLPVARVMKGSGFNALQVKVIPGPGCGVGGWGGGGRGRSGRCTLLPCLLGLDRVGRLGRT